MPRIVIIGAGPSGLCVGLKLKQAGIDDFVIVEQADGVGGTWRHNSYPGCRCDVPSILYSFSFADHPWSEDHATQPEILAYLERLAQEGGLGNHLRLSTPVVSARWMDNATRWSVNLPNGETLQAQFLISAVGLFNEPLIPAIPGLGDFPGPVMHSARWDRSIDLASKRVAVIGSAASAVQLVPELAKVARSLDIFQRTPNHVRPRAPEMAPDERRRFWADPARVAAEREAAFGWIDALCQMKDEALLAESERLCLDHIGIVRDARTRAALTPRYPFGAKRPLVSSEWYPAFNLPHVTLLTSPINRISPNRIEMADDMVREVDVIALATGFRTDKFASVIAMTGRGGLPLAQAWADGAHAYRGVTMRGFPNFFMLYGPNTNNGVIFFNIECQVDYILRHIGKMAEDGNCAIDVQQDALDAWNAQLQADIRAIAAWNAEVSSYYRNADGRNVTQWPHGMRRYRDELAAPDFDAYERIGENTINAEMIA
jgi:cyclohexanone monooxygenase